LCKSAESVGVIVGKTTTHTVTIEVTGRIENKSFVEVKHNDRNFLLLVTDMWIKDGKTYAKCSVIGDLPPTPFVPGTEVHPASHETIRNALMLKVSEKEGIYIGRLRNYHDIKVLLPIKNLGRIFITGRTGSGKSYTVAVFVEEFLKKEIPVVIIDRHGEYSSLKVPSDESKIPEGFDVSPRGYRDQIMEFARVDVNPGADLPIEAILTAEPQDLVASRQCTIINLRGLDPEEQHVLASEVLGKLFDAAMVGRIQPFFIVIDEAHFFAGKEKVPSKEIVRRIAQEGRKFGINMILVTQRPQLLDTTIRAQTGTWVIHCLVDYRDIDIAVKSAEGMDETWKEEIRRLDPGIAVITGDAVGRVPLLVRIRPRETIHGAEGFNPLEFVEHKDREEMERRREALMEKFSAKLREGRILWEKYIAKGRTSVENLRRELERVIRERDRLLRENERLKEENKRLRERLKELIRKAEEAIESIKRSRRL